MSRFEDHELIILETGRIGEPINGLREMSIGRHRYVEIKDAGLGLYRNDSIYRQRSGYGTCRKHGLPSRRVVKQITQSLRVSGHGNARDLQLMINLLRPNYLLVTTREYRELDAYARLAREVGFWPENIFIPKKGTIMEYDNGDFVPAGSVSAGDVPHRWECHWRCWECRSP